MNSEEPAETDNVVRFPVERRTTMAMLRQIAPDPREVSLLAQTYDIAVPADLEAQADASAAEFTLDQIPASGPERTEMLREMLASVLSKAFAAVRSADHQARAASVARAQLAAAATADFGYAVEEIGRHSAELSLAAAEALVVAHGRSLEAFGVGRAVDLALRGEPWTPRSVSAEMDWLIDAEVQRHPR